MGDGAAAGFVGMEPPRKVLVLRTRQALTGPGADSASADSSAAALTAQGCGCQGGSCGTDLSLLLLGAVALARRAAGRASRAS